MKMVVTPETGLKSEIDISISGLKNNDELLKILQSIIKELLRFFNIDIDKFEQGYNLFEETIERYFNVVFKKIDSNS